MKLCLRPSNSLLTGLGWCYCAPSVLAILFNRPYEEIRTLIQKRRERLKFKGILAEFRDHRKVRDVDWSEVIAMLKLCQPSIRSVTPNPKIRVGEFAVKNRHQKNVTYVIRCSDHCLIIKNGLVLDSFSDMVEPHRSLWVNSWVLDFCVLRNKAEV